MRNIISFAAMALIFAILRKGTKSAEVPENTVGLPKVMLRMSGMAGVLCVLLLLYAIYSGEAIVLLIAAGPSLLALSLLGYYYSVQITYGPSSFIVKRYWFKPVTYAYTDILGVTPRGNQGYKLHLKDRNLDLEEFCYGRLEFYAYMNDRFQALGLGEVPVRPSKVYGDKIL